MSVYCIVRVACPLSALYRVALSSDRCNPACIVQGNHLVQCSLSFSSEGRHERREEERKKERKNERIKKNVYTHLCCSYYYYYYYYGVKRAAAAATADIIHTIIARVLKR